MHHPQIYNLISIIEDYFIITDSEFRCQIEPVIYHKPSSPSLPNEDIRAYKGIKINRQLTHGRIEVNIFGSDKDSDSMDIQYFTTENPEQPLEIIEFGGFYSGKYKCNIDDVRAAIKKIVILDRKISLDSQ